MSESATCITAGLAIMVLFGLKIYFDVSGGSATIRGMSADRERQPFAYATIVGFDGLGILAGFILYVVGLML